MKTIAIGDIMTKKDIDSFLVFKNLINHKNLGVKQAFMLWVQDNKRVLNTMQDKEVLPEYFGYALEYALTRCTATTQTTK